MARTYTLNSPWLSIDFDGKPEYWRAMVFSWVTVMALFALFLIYVYAFRLPDVIGFEATLLVGILLIYFGVQSE